MHLNDHTSSRTPKYSKLHQIKNKLLQNTKDWALYTFLCGCYVNMHYEEKEYKDYILW